MGARSGGEGGGGAEGVLILSDLPMVLSPQLMPGRGLLTVVFLQGPGIRAGPG